PLIIAELEQSKERLDQQLENLSRLREVFGELGEPIPEPELNHLLVESVRVIITVTNRSSFDTVISAEVLPDFANAALIEQLRTWLKGVSALERLTRDDLAFRDNVMLPYYNASLSSAAMFTAYQNEYLGDYQLAPSQFDLNNFERLKSDAELENIIASKQTTLILQIGRIDYLIKNTQDIVRAIEVTTAS
ncbi:MAG: hypothetical protein AB8B95_14235, partial [Pseudohongiellaceae bacterium]